MEALLSIPEEEGLEVVEIQRKDRRVKARINYKEGEFVCESNVKVKCNVAIVLINAPLRCR